MNIWRLNIKPESEVGVDPRKFCLERNILGVGWQIESNSDNVGWEEYYEKANKYYRVEGGYKGWWRALNPIKNRIKEHDLCWTRDLSGIYYLGRVTDSEWKYLNHKSHRRADIVNCRNCEWNKVGEVDSVPGTIVNRFIRGGAIERIIDDRIREFSKFLYNCIEQKSRYSINRTKGDIFTLMHSDDLEDIVGLYLQSKGYKLIPSSCKRSTVNYEYVLKKSSGKKAVAQVKMGNVNLKFSDYENLRSEVYLFTEAGRYVGEPAPNIHIIKKQELQEFIIGHKDMLPDKVKTWINLNKQLEDNSWITK